MWADLEKYAKMADMSVNAYVARAIAKALSGPQSFATGAADSRGPLRKLRKGEPIETAGGLLSVQLGPTPAKPGSRLKGPRK
jgi:hypothetical protein